MGQLYAIDGDGEGRLSIRAIDVTLSPLPEIEGKANVGFSYGAGFGTSSGGISVARGRFEANGKVTPHRTRNLYIVHVVRGSGELVLFDRPDQTTRVPFQADDVFVLPPGTMHQWLNGNEPFDFVGIECADPAAK